ncbi:hypothetical protein PXK30_03665 [Phaeobacter gallaeciensis]|uniref:hypothetical protein n=1 Tax=Phaeobacter gallaeciensis TaxID=60890 RepID=UPI00237F28E1|nr:hypothetical protein [Phaeobacter gallaeciensis]MDE4304005.1 hypothetical protein [Phaeobacter gallaeciensis]MDE4309065.1 hypothetical protein [Phaeobacter gallaeciensis]MDE4313381.1 hypothetical protein [Phaeobacter gallaeciensis]MDE4317994.1 hypothetical protein [Phaeobacter gallaeciensis]MDE4322457.1 hypothetical protein [Phaeobacter gallaeciensis]
MGIVEDLKHENANLRKLLDQAQRAGQRQPTPSAPTLFQPDLPAVVRYPLAEFAAERGKNVPLPESVQEIAEVIGRRNAVRLVEGTRQTGGRKWRRQLYVPGDMKEDHRIAAMIGVEAALLLSKSHAHCILELPSCHGLRKAYMADHALRQWDAGASISEIAQEMGIEIKTAQGLLDQADYWRNRLG